MKPEKTKGIACSIFRKEIEYLKEQKLIDMPVRYISSMLHMDPEELDKRIKKATENEQLKGNDIVLVFGDCCPNMTEIGHANNIHRSTGLNCVEILLGRDLFRQMRSDGVFFLMHEWTLRWQEVFQHEIGLEGDNARSLMNDMHTKFVYLDTGLSPVPGKHLAEISEYCGLPVEIMKISLNTLMKKIKDADKEQ